MPHRKFYIVPFSECELKRFASLLELYNFPTCLEPTLCTGSLELLSTARINSHARGLSGSLAAAEFLKACVDTFTC